MVVPPSYAKAVTIKNTAAYAVHVTAVFGSDEQEAEGQAKIREEKDLAPNEQVSWEHTYDMGSWKAVAALLSVDVEPAASAKKGALTAVASEHFEPAVRGVVDNLNVEVGSHPSTHALQISTP